MYTPSCTASNSRANAAARRSTEGIIDCGLRIADYRLRITDYECGLAIEPPGFNQCNRNPQSAIRNYLTPGVGVLLGKCPAHFCSFATRMFPTEPPDAYICIASRP